jgi:phosphoserine phosphatase SerB
MPGARSLVSTMRADGHACALVSGGFTFFTERVAHAVGFNTNRANRLVFANGKLTGGVAEPILGRQAKLDALIHLREELGLKPNETLAVGDGANDLAMIGEAGLGIAYHAKPVVAEAAAARIDHGDLTALLAAGAQTISPRCRRVMTLAAFLGREFRRDTLAELDLNPIIVPPAGSPTTIVDALARFG